MTPFRIVVAAVLASACRSPPSEESVPPSTLVIVNGTTCPVLLDGDEGIGLTAPAGATEKHVVDSLFCTLARIDAGACASTIATRNLCFDGDDVCVVAVEPDGCSVVVTTSEDCETAIVVNDDLL